MVAWKRWGATASATTSSSPAPSPLGRSRGSRASASVCYLPGCSSPASRRPMERSLSTSGQSGSRSPPLGSNPAPGASSDWRRVLDGCVEEVGGYHVGYDIKLSSTESPRSVTGLEGVRVRVLFAWVPITGVEAVDGEVTVHIGPIRKSFPAVGFKSSPRCIIRLEAWSLVMGWRLRIQANITDHNIKCMRQGKEANRVCRLLDDHTYQKGFSSIIGKVSQLDIA
ncbi:hypothetical protein ZEAMMB73_Zm00001d007595 [Zea mays]|uniref:Uncharacterized protein n=1 Tax=Zea mays TaxID=4577 RepID=A0A1D6F7F4_MAIZE|nr:hypothetical protein ZEAMMB73_Zm00001d007595 [Zea mays]